ncbi:DNA polymerase III subunit delta [Clostridium homopropionicum DSM 5847]|uniref:DNA polymerase III subunit delta n=1 Tax=Clostridium homopropionicum DSM 5847 TaxID=1121318 RepID=A0A0L6ZEQ3_9CLOT|nr:DNA polymerase III subunit delta [Clostridium homopropionicum]KOA21253.1 DNA polymerase III subunit delta [Clostridium homopropionicum DSM 5847]SFG28754.1 DNA polymerase III, delta subunit [Clostridium homopropionicum]
MKDVLYLEEQLSKNRMSNCYIFCGSDEHSIKNYINKIVAKFVNKDFLDFNYSEIDGLNANIDNVRNACETLPFMSEKKAVVIYRANFLRDKVDKALESSSKEIMQYINNIPSECILIMYYIFENDREKESNKVRKLEKAVLAIKMSKLKGNSLSKKVTDILKDKGKDINKSDLAILCNNVENNLDIIENELEKLYCYTIDREITGKDILDIITKKNDNDIFNLVDFISQRKPQKSLDILNELIFKGEIETSILRMIQRQFKLLFIIKLGIETGKSKEQLSSELKLNPFICEKMMQQSSKFTLNQLKQNVEASLETERILKSKSVDSKLEMELLILKSTTIKI